ncbi:hypothetical protein [Streptomyces violaceusniger]|uniref:Lipoprotein n=1 Tax=Streptomyces violaceusniger (strain Tu 4113) TaxID=653045 RepID=G2PB07_STRV4|nr:hypothetical protein [Streptomyces violaceusniger]AEM88406.1 lipoprotein [Streptomyces violaceusniger Tu 4113]
MSTTTTNRFRGRAGRRIAATIVAAAALGLGATACGPDSDAADSGGSSASSTASPSQQASSQPTSGSSSGNSGSQGQNGGGTADAGKSLTIVGKMEYLAPGKLIVKPEDGGTDQAFLVANATTIRGAAAICTAPDGSVAIGDDGYGTAKCTVDELEKAAKTNSVTVRVTMDRKSGGADTVEEKYHP